MLVTLPRLVLAVLAAPPTAKADTQACVASFEHAQRLRAETKLLAARAELRACAAEACPSSVTTMCLTWLREVDDALPTVTVGARTENGADVLDVRVWIDGSFVQTSGLPIEIDPGPHTVRGEALGGQSIEEKLIVNAGERNRLVRLTFRSPKRRAPEDEPVVPHGSKAVPIAMGVASTILVGVGSVLAIQAGSDLGALRSGCGATRSCAADDVDSVKARMTIGDALIGVGVVSLAVAAWLFLR
jgi:hypothetical protein